jgi:hypothetical protein
MYGIALNAAFPGSQPALLHRDQRSSFIHLAAFVRVERGIWKHGLRLTTEKSLFICLGLILINHSLAIQVGVHTNSESLPLACRTPYYDDLGYCHRRSNIFHMDDHTTLVLVAAFHYWEWLQIWAIDAPLVKQGKRAMRI